MVERLRHSTVAKRERKGGAGSCGKRALRGSSFRVLLGESETEWVVNLIDYSLIRFCILAS